MPTKKNTAILIFHKDINITKIYKGNDKLYYCEVYISHPIQPTNKKNKTYLPLTKQMLLTEFINLNPKEEKVDNINQFIKANKLEITFISPKELIAIINSAPININIDKKTKAIVYKYNLGNNKFLFVDEISDKTLFLDVEQDILDLKQINNPILINTTKEAEETKEMLKEKLLKFNSYYLENEKAIEITEKYLEEFNEYIVIKKPDTKKEIDKEIEIGDR